MRFARVVLVQYMVMAVVEVVLVKYRRGTMCT